MPRKRQNCEVSKKLQKQAGGNAANGLFLIDFTAMHPCAHSAKSRRPSAPATRGEGRRPFFADPIRSGAAPAGRGRGAVPDAAGSVHPLVAPEEQCHGAGAGVASDGGADIVNLYLSIQMRKALFYQ